MKLIRLVTNDDGFFRSSFGNEMMIKPNSKIALLNLTFETAFTVINIDSSNSTVEFVSDTDDIDTKVEVDLNERSYNRNQVEDFYKDLIFTLNACVSNEKASNSIGSMLDINEAGGLRQIEYRYSPFLNPLFLPDQNNVFSLDNELIDVIVDDAGPTTIQKQGSQGGTSDRTANLITSVGRLCEGNGFLMIRIKSSVDNLSGGANNGFGIGLTREQLDTVITPGEDIPPNTRDFEIRYNRPGEQYVYIKNTEAVESGSGIMPINVEGGNLYDHDVLYFKTSNGRLSGGVIQLVAADEPTVQEFFDVAMDSNDIFYPYLYLRGSSTHIKVDAFNYNINPWINQGYGVDEIKPPFWSFTGLDYPGNIHNAYANGVQDIVDTGTLFDGIDADEVQISTPSNWKTGFQCQITLDTEIWNLLGYGYDDFEGDQTKRIAVGPNSFRNCWSLWLAKNDPVIQDSDNYLIESLSLPLDSFDASQPYYGSLVTNNFPRKEQAMAGRRKNILMTVPINNNTDGLVEYETDNLIFIDINNAEQINVRNMDFRILKKDFTPIEQSGESAVMTILISD